MPPRRASSPATSSVERMRFRRAPLLAAAVAFCVRDRAGEGGAAASRGAGCGVGFAGAASAFGDAVCLACGGFGRYLACGRRWGWRRALWQPSPVQPVRLLGLADGLSRTVRGHVVQVRVPPVAPVVDGHEDADSVPAWEASEDVSTERGRPMSLDFEVEAIEEVTPRYERDGGSAGGRACVGVSSARQGCSGPWRFAVATRWSCPCGCGRRSVLAIRACFNRRTGCWGRALRRRVVCLPTGLCGWAARRRRWLAGCERRRRGRVGRMLGFADSSENARLPRLLRLSDADAQMLNADAVRRPHRADAHAAGGV